MLRAILSTTLLQLEGVYEYMILKETDPPTILTQVKGVNHHVEHPATRYLLNKMGAKYDPSPFLGLNPGDSILVCQLKDYQKGQPYTGDPSEADLKWSIVTRLS